MKAILSIPAVGGGFFFSAWPTMTFWGIIAPDFGIATVAYVQTMLVTIAVWLVVAPMVGAVARGSR